MLKTSFFKKKNHLTFTRHKWLCAAKFTLLLILILFLSAIEAKASLYWQQTNGPYGAYGKCLDVAPTDPNIIFIGTEWSGIYKSMDGGASWQIKNNGLIEFPALVYDIEIDPIDENIVYMSSAGNGLAKSTDGGNNWITTVNKNLLDINIYDIAIDPQNTQILYAATQLWGLRKSMNGGASWESGNLQGIGKITCVDVVTTGSYSVIYAGTEDEGVWKSTDGASSWDNILQNERVTAIGACPSAPESYLYVGYYNTIEARYKVKKTTDAGNSWFDMTGYSSTNYYVSSIAVDRSSKETAYISSTLYVINANQYPPGIITGSKIYKTNNPFNLTQKFNTQAGILDSQFFEVEIDPTDTSRIFACGTGRGFFISTNEGESWVFSNDGINNAYVTALMSVPTTEGSGSIIYAGTRALGIFRSFDQGNSWEEINEGLNYFGSYIYPSAFTFDPNDPSLIFAGVGTTIYKSTDYGSTWVSSLSMGAQINVVESDPRENGVFYAGTNGGSRIYRSTDSGGTWEAWQSNLADYAVLELIATSYEGRTAVHAGLSGDMGIYRRFTDEPSFESVSGGLIGPAITINDFEQNYSSPEVIYAGVTSALYSKTIEAESWDILTIFGPSVLSVADDPTNPLVSYQQDYYRRIWRTTVGGGKVREETGLEQTSSIMYGRHYKPIIFDRFSSPSVIYADINARSVWKTSVFSGDVPIPPINLKGSPESISVIKWTWVDSSLNEDGFKLYKLDHTLVDSTPSKTVELLEGTLSTNTGYQRLIAAYNAYGETTSEASPVVYTLAELPGTPEAKNIGPQHVVITWEGFSNPSYTRYDVWMSTEESLSHYHEYWENLATVTTSEFSTMTYRLLSPEATYWFKVRALNEDDIYTDFGGENFFTTGSLSPSADVIPPDITSVRFDDRLYYLGSYGEGDIIYHTPRVSAIITDKASIEPDVITPEGIDVTSVKIKFNDYVFEVPPSALSGDPTLEVYLNYLVPARLGSTTYMCTIEAKDIAYPRYNTGRWTGKVRVMGEEIEAIGPTIAYPTPYKPQTQGDITISYTLSTNANVSIYTYDISGQVVMRRNYYAGSEGGRAGYNGITWNGISDIGGGYVGNGIYVYKIVSGGKVITTGKIVVFE